MDWICKPSQDATKPTVETFLEIEASEAKMSDDIQKAISYMYTGGKEYGNAKASVTYITEFLKSKRSILMKEAMANGAKSVAAAEIEALSHPDYIALLDGIREATEKAESMRWALIAAQSKVDVWRSEQASNRMMDKVTM